MGSFSDATKSRIANKFYMTDSSPPPIGRQTQTMKIIAIPLPLTGEGAGGGEHFFSPSPPPSPARGEEIERRGIL
jgi:hypothetical protein